MAKSLFLKKSLPVLSIFIIFTPNIYILLTRAYGIGNILIAFTASAEINRNTADWNLFSLFQAF